MTCATYATDSDAAERYVLGQMGEAEQASFEEHFFGCDACFASVQTLQQMQTALRGAPALELPPSNRAAVTAGAVTAGPPRRRGRDARAVDRRRLPETRVRGNRREVVGTRGRRHAAAHHDVVAEARRRRRSSPGRPWRGTSRRRRLRIRRLPTRRQAPNRPATNQETDSRARRFPATGERWTKPPSSSPSDDAARGAGEAGTRTRSAGHRHAAALRAAADPRIGEHAGGIVRGRDDALQREGLTQARSSNSSRSPNRRLTPRTCSSSSASRS